MSQTPRSRPDSYQRLGSVPVPGSHNDNLDNVQIEVPHGQQPQEHVQHRAYNDTMPIVNQAMPIDTQYSQPHEPQEPQAYYQMLSYPSLAVSTEHEPPQQFQPDQKASYEVAVPIDQSLNHEISSQPSVTSTSHTLLPPPQPYGSLPPPGYSEPPQKGLPAETAVIEMDTIHAGGQNVARIAANLQTNKMVRLAFVRKVYTLLAAQLAVTIGISFWFINDPSVKNWATNHQWLFFVSWGLALLDLCLLYWLRQKHPWNIILLFVFTLCISYAVATVVSVYDTRVVLQAFLITFGVFLALVVFTLQSKIDFESWGPFLYAFLWVVIFAGFIAWLFPPDRGFHVAISGLSALLFSGYIIYDTYMIFNKLSPEEYILAAIDLYLDIVNLFIAVLALLGGTDS